MPSLIVRTCGQHASGNKGKLLLVIVAKSHKCSVCMQNAFGKASTSACIGDQNDIVAFKLHVLWEGCVEKILLQ